MTWLMLTAGLVLLIGLGFAYGWRQGETATDTGSEHPQTIDGHVLGAVVGVGSTAVVNQVTPTSVIKRPLPGRTPDQLAAFAQEMKLHCSVSHPHIVPICGSGSPALPYLLLPDLTGGGLLEHSDLRSGAADARLAAVQECGVQIGWALRYLHAGVPWGDQILPVVHGDVSPDNIWHKDGSWMLGDFGNAVVLDGTGSTDLRGSMAYLPPESLEHAPATPAFDRWSLAVILWELVAGRPLFWRGNDPATLLAIAKAEVPLVHPAWDGWFQRALRLSPDERFRTTDDFIAALQSLSLEET